MYAGDATFLTSDSDMGNLANIAIETVIQALNWFQSLWFFFNQDTTQNIISVSETNKH